MPHPEVLREMSLRKGGVVEIGEAVLNTPELDQKYSTFIWTLHILCVVFNRVCMKKQNIRER
jgi:hypothetical protein